MIHLAIRCYRRNGGDESEQVELGDTIHERDMTIGEALELVIGNMMERVGNVGTTLQRARGISTAEECMEVALSHEYYIGPWPPENMDAVWQNWYSYWYSFTHHTFSAAGRPNALEEDQNDVRALYSAVMVYYRYYENTGAYLYASPEFRRHDDRRRRKRTTAA